MASYDFLEMKQRHPDWIWPRSDTHMVVGLPGTMECYKTWVEPGNSLSPGIASFGISIWICSIRFQHRYFCLYAVFQRFIFP